MDGYHGKEIAAIPTEVVEIFYEVTAQWREKEEVPNIMRIIRQASLPKEGKPLEVPNLRPISVLSAWWRLFEGSSLQTPMFQEWRKNIGVEGVAYREAAERVAAKASMDLQELGFLGAMDYSKAYDKMDPWISGRAMEETGIPGSLVRTLLKVWRNQERWVQFDGQLGKEALHTAMAHPQGGPWGPAVMQLWMAGEHSE